MQKKKYDEVKRLAKDRNTWVFDLSTLPPLKLTSGYALDKWYRLKLV